MKIFLPQLCVKLAFVTILVNCEHCSDGWFGNRCRFQCHCARFKKCEIDGSCSANESCANGYFGPSCQFLDLIATETVQYMDNFMFDSDDKTCNPNKSSTTVTINLLRSILLTWFRITVNDKQLLFSFTTKLDDNEVCTTERKFKFSEDTVDVICEGDIITPTLEIVGLIAGSICSVHISGGQNFALKQKTWQSSTIYNDTETFGADKAVDGSSDILFNGKHCSLTSIEVISPQWQLTLDKPYLVSSIVILTNTEHAFLLKGSTVAGLNANDIAVLRHEMEFRDPEIKYVIELNYLTVIKTITITQSNNIKLNKYMGICEVLVLGECVPGSYGAGCEISCDDNCAGTCNYATGVCKCKTGHTGSRCSECRSGYFGDTCTKMCPPLCKDGLCDKVTGVCLSCTQNHAGDHCDVCSATFYGPECRKKCPITCLNRICTSTLGTCISCIKGYSGELCQEEVLPQLDFLWLLVPIIIIALLVAYCVYFLYFDDTLE